MHRCTYPHPDVHSCIFFTPSGAAMMHMKWMCFTPLSLSIWIAAVADPPVASIGSTTKTSRSCRICRQFAVIFHRLQCFGITVQTDMTDLCSRNRWKAYRQPCQDLLAGSAQQPVFYPVNSFAVVVQIGVSISMSVSFRSLVAS